MMHLAASRAFASLRKEQLHALVLLYVDDLKQEEAAGAQIQAALTGLDTDLAEKCGGDRIHQALQVVHLQLSTMRQDTCEIASIIAAVLAIPTAIVTLKRRSHAG
jgi:hypothetical protein